MALQGTHRTFSVPELFNLVCTRRMSGMLVIASRGQDRTFFLQNGEIVYATANEPGHLLGELLSSELGVDPEVIERVSGRIRGGLIGEKLVRTGVVDQEGLNSVLEREVRQLLREVLHWREWAFHFQRLPDNRLVTRLGLSTQLMIFDMTRELDEWESVNEMFGDLDQTPVRNGGSLQLKIDWAPDLPPLGEVLESTAGMRTLRTVLKQSAYPCRSHALAIQKLMAAGVLRLEATALTAGARSPLQQHMLAAISPRLAERVLRATTSAEETNLETLAPIAISDPVVVARIIQVSGLQKRPRTEPFSLRALVRALGTQQLSSLLQAEAVRSLFLNPWQGDAGLLWEECYLAGEACTMIAERIRYAEVELARCAGFLQDIGRIVLMGRHPAEYEQTCGLERIHSEQLTRLENARFGVDHCQAGSELAQAWGFPPQLTELIRHHHDPIMPRMDDRLFHIVRLANHIVEASRGSVAEFAAAKKMVKLLEFPGSELENLKNHLTDWQNRPVIAGAGRQRNA